MQGELMGRAWAVPALLLGALHLHGVALTVLGHASGFPFF